MTTSGSKGRFFYKTNWFESIRITNQIDLNRELECSNDYCLEATQGIIRTAPCCIVHDNSVQWYAQKMQDILKFMYWFGIDLFFVCFFLGLTCILVFLCQLRPLFWFLFCCVWFSFFNELAEASWMIYFVSNVM